MGKKIKKWPENGEKKTKTNFYLTEKEILVGVQDVKKMK